MFAKTEIAELRLILQFLQIPSFSTLSDHGGEN
jgi:hypothetical protein